jgi:predicted HicB family RNase H-like nuclease
VTQSVVRPEVSHYAYRVVWSAEDQEFVATCAEFPSLSWLAPDQVEALQGLEILVGDVLDDLEAEGAELPQPLAERPYSGKLNLRLGPDLHRQVALEAAEAGLSLNSYLCAKSADRAWTGTGPSPQTASTHQHRPRGVESIRPRQP